jgi:hypothetical protein
MAQPTAKQVKVSQSTRIEVREFRRMAGLRRPVR